MELLQAPIASGFGKFVAFGGWLAVADLAW